jgi:hypothetical protein
MIQYFLTGGDRRPGGRTTFNVASIEIIETIQNAPNGSVCIVSDIIRGGVFVYDSSKSLINNKGTIFNGWIRQHTTNEFYADWFPFHADGITDDKDNFRIMEDAMSDGDTAFFNSKTYFISESNGADDNGVVFTKRISIVGNGETVFKSTVNIGETVYTPYSVKFIHDDTELTNYCKCSGIIFSSCRVEVNGTRNFHMDSCVSTQCRCAIRFHNNIGLKHSNSFVYDTLVNLPGGTAGDTFLYTQNTDFEILNNSINHLDPEINTSLIVDKGKGFNIYGGDNFHGKVHGNSVYANEATVGGIQVYSETLNISKYADIIVTGNICVNGENPLYNYQCNGVTFSDNTVISPRFGHGVYVYKAGGTVVNGNRIDKANEFNDNIGIYISESPSSIVTNNLITDAKNGISFANTIGGVCTGNILKRVTNLSYMNNGILILGCDGVIVSNNEIYNYTNGVAILDGAVSHNINSNMLHSCTYGINIFRNVSRDLKQISIAQNVFYGSFDIGIKIDTTNSLGAVTLFLKLVGNDYTEGTYLTSNVDISGGAENYYWLIGDEKYLSKVGGVTVNIDKYYYGTISRCLFTFGAGSAVGFAIGDLGLTHISDCDFHEMAKAIDINGGDKNVISGNFFRACGIGAELSANNSKAVVNYNIDTTTTVSDIGTSNTIAPNY